MAAFCREIAAYICGDQGTGRACDKTSPTFSRSACAERAWGSVGGDARNPGPCVNCNRLRTPDGPPSAANCNFNPTCVIQVEGDNRER